MKGATEQSPAVPVTAFAQRARGEGMRRKRSASLSDLHSLAGSNEDSEDTHEQPSRRAAGSSLDKVHRLADSQVQLDIATVSSPAWRGQLLVPSGCLSWPSCLTHCTVPLKSACQGPIRAVLIRLILPTGL